MEELTDNQIMQLVCNGDLERLSTLFDRYSGLLYAFFIKRTGIHEVSEDLVQEVFLRVMKYRHSFRPSGKFSAWLYSIANNVKNSAYRKQFGRFHIMRIDLERHYAEEPEDTAALPDAIASRNQEKAALYEALEKLPLEKQQIIVMRHIQGLEYEQMEAILGLEGSTLRVRVHRALQDLKEQMHQLLKENRYELSEY